MGLGEAEAGVQDHLGTIHPGGVQLGQALTQFGLDSGDDAAGVVGEPVHGLGVAAPVLADVDDTGAGDEAVHGGVGQAPGDVVDDVGAGVDGSLGGGGVDGVH